MENQHKLIKGYRDLSAEEIALMNEAKELAEKVSELVCRVAHLPCGEPVTTSTDPGRAIEIARTDLQTGFMWLIRSIARSTTF